MRNLKLRPFLPFLFFFLTGTLVFGQQIKLDRCFPDSTKIFVSVSNVQELGESWSKTNLHETLSAPAFKDFRESLRQQIEEAWPNKLGITIEDFSNLPTGEIGGGLIAIPGKKPGFAVIMNVNGNTKEVNEFLSKLIRKVTSAQKGVAAKEKLTAGQQTVDATVLTFPNDADNTTSQSIYYVALPQLLIATDQKYLAELLLRRLAGEKQPSLSSRPEYQAIFKRCAADSKNGEEPQVKFFANPLAAGEAIRAMLPADAQKGRSPFDALAKQGFDGIKGVGGTIDFSTEKYEFVYRLKVYIPEEPTRALKVLAFNNVDKLDPPIWAGENAARYTSINLNALTAFNSVGPLFDEFLETEGAWDEILEQLETDQVGPRVNLRSDLFANFGRNLTTMNAFDSDKIEEGEKYVFALNIVDGKEQDVANALQKMFETDPDFKKVELDGNVFWQLIPQQANAKSPRSTSSKRPNARRTSSRRPSAETVAKPSGPEVELIKGALFGVANGQLYVSNDAQYLQKQALTKPTTSILDSPVHKQAMGILANDPAAANGIFVLGYGRNIDGLRENYELFRQGRTPEGKTISAKLLNTILTPPGQKEPRKPRFDGTSLPPFDDSFVDHIGFNCFFGVVEKDGEFYKGFSCRPQD